MPDISHQIKIRLLALAPRAFELFAGDLLSYVGLQNVTVTRASGDGGIDAYGDLVAASGLMRISAAVQVKRYRHNVGRPEIDRFIGAYGGQYDRGIFITTAGYAEQARVKAATAPVLRVDTIDGDQLVALMRRHSLGVAPAHTGDRLDEAYFIQFEEVAAQPGQIGEAREPYIVQPTGIAVQPADDLISLRALSHALRIDTTVVRRWIEQERLAPDLRSPASIFFRRDRIPQIRAEFLGRMPPQSPDGWREEFIEFTRSRSMTKSYKPVMLKVLLGNLDRDGAAPLAAIVAGFRAFYLARREAGIPVEFGPPDPCELDDAALRQLILKNPLERFLIKGFLEHQGDIVRIAPQLWSELRHYELLDIQANTDEQLRHYYGRRR